MKTCLNVRLAAVALLATVGLASTASAINVTYQVNMSVQEAIGKFNPGTDTVFVSGDLSNPDWLQTATDGATNYTLTVNAENSDIYEGTFAIDIASGGWENHKFVINRGDTFGNNKWEDTIDNRYFQVPATDTNLPVVFFDDVDVVPPVRNVTFQVDMSLQIALTNFNPATDFVNVAGSFNDWDTTISELSQSVTNTNVYVGTFIVAGLTNTVSQYKFVMWTFVGGEVWEGVVGPYGTDSNRGILLSETDQTEPLVCFNNLCSVPYDIPVTFRVNMAAQTAYGSFADGVNTVTAAGSFNGWDAAGFVLTNDPGSPYVYQGTTNVLGTNDQAVAYKYVIDGGTSNELYELYGMEDRTFIHGTNSLTLNTVFFDDVDNLGQVTAGPAAGNQVDVSWNPGALVRLQLSTNLANGWVDVPSTTGESNATVTITTDENYFRLIGP